MSRIISISAQQARWAGNKAKELQDLEFKINKKLKKTGKLKLVKLKRISNKMEKVQLELRQMLSQYNSVCKNCKRCCCDGSNHFYKDYDILYTLLRDSKIPVPMMSVRVHKGREPRIVCLFLGKSGCEIEGHLRPKTCVDHTCPSLTNRMTKKGWKRFRELRDEYNKLCDKLNTAFEKRCFFM